MKTTLVAILIASATLCQGADLTGDWIAEVTAKGADPQYARVQMKAEGSGITGSWNQLKLEGALEGASIKLSLLRSGSPAGTLSGTGGGNAFSGAGQVSGSVGGSGGGGRGGGGRAGGRAGSAQMEAVTWKLTRLQPPATGPKIWDYEPTVFHGYYSAAYPPVLRVYPGDTIRTRTYDAVRDAALRATGGNLETGPFYIEGALPGDTLAVKLNRVRVNRDSARQGSRINGRALTPASVAAMEYDPAFDSEWKLDREKGIAMLAHPTERLKNFTVPILPMIGCISVAPPGDQSYRATDLGTFGGNMDYNQMGEGVTLYLPVSHAGALLTLGDAHAAMGDGELTGSALETSVDVELTVDVIKGYATGYPRLENADYIMSLGVGGSIPDALQIATSQLVDWLKRDYKLSDSEVSVLLGAVGKYDIAELVDPHFSVVAKVAKSALKPLR